MTESLRAFMMGDGARPGAGGALGAGAVGGERARRHDPRPGVIVLGSGKGGVGTSTLSALLAVEAARAGARTLLVDGDEGIGTLHLMFAIDDPGPGVGALRDPGVEPRALLRSVAPSLSLLAGGGAGADATLAAATGERRALFRRVSGLYDRFDVVIVDGGSRLESVMAACVIGAERLLCVTTCDRLASAASYALFKVARTRLGALPIDLLVNRADAEAARAVHRVVRSATERFLATRVAWGGAVPFDPALPEQVRKGASLADLSETGAARTGARELVARLVGSRLEETGQPFGSDTTGSVTRIPNSSSAICSW